ncbi:MAG: TniQ family protein [Lachnospiraceae bacterium]|nr:TniQ family protein [Lachnospiraceae bacterium]
MGIVYFPEPYPDELIFSVLARYYVHSGYPAYTFCAEDIFADKKVRPDMEFLNVMRLEVLEALCKKKPMAELVEKHTMFPYYARFLPCERRNKAFEALYNMSGDYNNLLAVPKQKNGEKKYLRYCPMCVEEDRQLYGESYWHRSHQMAGVRICPVHGCRLLNSSAIISGKASPNLITAEQAIKEMDIIYENEVEIQLAEYVGKVFQSDMDMKNPVAVGQFLHSQMAGTEYLSARGEQRNIQKLYDDFMVFYKDLSLQGLTELWQVQKVFNNYRLNCFEVCQIAMFLNIPIEKLCNMELPDRTQEQIFDDKVKELHRQGLKYPEIAKRLNASYNVVKPVGAGSYGKYSYGKKVYQKGGAKPKDWERIDRESLPLVKATVKQLWSSEDERPHRVTKFAVCKILGFPDKRLELMPLCKNEVLKYQESQEQYWAREMVWAVGKIQKEGKNLNWKQVRILTNMRKINAMSCLPYLKVIAEPVLYDKVQALL